MDGELTSGLIERYELLSKLFGQATQGTFFGFEDLLLVVRDAFFDVVIALDHDAPEPGGEFARQGYLCTLRAASLRSRRQEA